MKPRIIRTAAAVAALAVLAAPSALLPANAANRATSVAGPKWTCTYTPVEYMIHAGGSALSVDPGHASFSMTASGSGAMEDPYITAGYNASLNSALCNSREIPGSGGKHGRSPALPVRLGKQGHPFATANDWTSSDFRGDSGYDMWLSADPNATTYTQLANGGSGTTEIMIWLSHPHLSVQSSNLRYYPVHIDGLHWGVTIGLAANGHGRSPAHPNGWSVVNFIAPQVSEGNVSVHNLSLDQFMSYAISRGYLGAHDYLMSVNQGFEDWAGTAAVKSYAMVGLK